MYIECPWTSTSALNLEEDRVGAIILGDSSRIKEGDEVEIDLSKGLIRNVTTKKDYKAMPFPPFMQGIIDAGGLIEYTRKKIHG